MGTGIVSCQESHFAVKKWVDLRNIVLKKREAEEIFLYMYATNVICMQLFFIIIEFGKMNYAQTDTPYMSSFQRFLKNF